MARKGRYTGPDEDGPLETPAATDEEGLPAAYSEESLDAEKEYFEAVEEEEAAPVRAQRAAPVQAAPVRTRRRPPAAPTPMPIPQGRGYSCADVVTAIFLLLSVLVVSYTILLIANPRSPLNPLPFPTYQPLSVLPSPLPSDTPTRTFTPEPFTATPTATNTPLPTATNTATQTPTSTPTPVVGAGIPTKTSAAQATAPLYTQSAFPFTTKPL